MMQRKEEFRDFLRRNPRFTLDDAQLHGFSRAMVAYYAKRGDISRLARGVYCDAMSAMGNRLEIETLAACGYEFTVALFSALRIHGFTTANPAEVWIAVPTDSRKPAGVSFPVRTVWLGERPYNYGFVSMQSGGVSYKVFSPAKTVADLFKFRNKYGLDIAIEALKEGWRKRMFTSDELHLAAVVCRVSRVIAPYMEGIMS